MPGDMYNMSSSGRVRAHRGHYWLIDVNDKKDLHESGLRISSWNIHGLNSMKLEHSDLLSLLDEQDIIILTETWKRNNDLKTINNNIHFDEDSVCWQAVKEEKLG